MVINDLGQSKSRRTRKKEATAKRLFDVGLDLFRKQGFEKTSVQQICDHADVAKGTFFNYYPTKEHLLLGCHDRFKQEMLDYLQSTRFESSRQAVLAAFHYWGDHVTAEPELGRALLRTIFGSKLLLDSDQKMSQRLHDWLVDQVSRDIEKGVVNEDLEVATFISILFNVLSATTNEFLTSEDPEPINRTLTKRCGFLFDAVER